MAHSSLYTSQRQAEHWMGHIEEEDDREISHPLASEKQHIPRQERTVHPSLFVFVREVGVVVWG
jgi:hypothetical protein